MGLGESCEENNTAFLLLITYEYILPFSFLVFPLLHSLDTTSDSYKEIKSDLFQKEIFLTSKN